MSVASETYSRGPNALQVARWALYATWATLGVVQLAADVAAIGGELTHHADANDESSNIIRLPVVNIHIRDSIIDELTGFTGGGGPGDDDNDWWKTIITRAITYGGLSAATLASALNVDESVIRKWMGGENAPKPYVRKSVARIIISLMMGL